MEGLDFSLGNNARKCSRPIVPSVERMWLRLGVAGIIVIIGSAYRAPWQDVVTFFDAITDFLKHKFT